MRIPMRPKDRTQWVADDDVMVRQRLDPPRVGRNVEVVVSEVILEQIGARALEHAVERAGHQFAYEHQHEIHEACSKLLLDAEWIKPILEDELRQAAREMVLSLWSGEEKAALRSWFDLLTAKAK